MDESTSLTVVYEKDRKRIRCIYLGHLRIVGTKPYVTEHLPRKQYDVALSDLDDVLSFARKDAGSATARHTLSTDTDKTRDEKSSV